MNIEASCVNRGKIKKTLKSISRGSVESEEALSLDPTKDAGDIILEKLAVVSTKYLQICPVPKAWENSTKTLMHNKKTSNT